jgi:hypothetical protein
VTSAEPAGATGPDAALCDAVATEHAVIYGYGVVSAYSRPDLNSLIAGAIHQHRDRRDQAIAMLTARSLTAPIAAAGYDLPIPVNKEDDAARLAVQMEDDTAVAWRAVVEQGREPEDREFAVTSLAQSAVLAALWNRVLGNWPITRAFPGGSE